MTAYVRLATVGGGIVGSSGVGYTRQGSLDFGPSMPSRRYDTSDPDRRPPLYERVIMLPVCVKAINK